MEPASVKSHRHTDHTPNCPAADLWNRAQIDGATPRSTHANSAVGGNGNASVNLPIDRQDLPGPSGGKLVEADVLATLFVGC
jgi:hypothetical protein